MSQDTHSDQSHTLQCGHEDTGQETIVLVEVGAVCRSCYTPYHIDRWDECLRSTKAHHRTGETTSYHTWLVGLDAYGRAIYHDELNKQLLRVVPMHHHVFRADRTGDEPPLRDYPSRGPGDGRLLNAPDNRDLLVVVNEIDIDADHFSKRALVSWVGSHLADGQIKTLSDDMCDILERYVIKDLGGRTDNEFPIEAVESRLSED